jgi:hypothetical protein
VTSDRVLGGPNRPGLVIAWMPFSQRSATLARRLSFDLVLFRRVGFRRPWLSALSYPILAARTFMLVIRRRPSAVLVVAPPVVAPFVVAVARPIVRFRWAIDVHTGALLDRRWRWTVPLLRMLSWLSDATIVTLDSLVPAVDPRGRRTLVIPDPLPDLDGGESAVDRRTDHLDHPSRPQVTAICGWADDEPLEALVEAARGRPWDLTLTGRPTRRLSLPENVRTSGFLDARDYVRVLRSSDLLLALTMREQTLLSGAWDALAVGAPLVVSATKALIDTFGPSIATAGATGPSIRQAIEQALADDSARARSRDLARRFRDQNDALMTGLERRLRR